VSGNKLTAVGNFGSAQTFAVIDRIDVFCFQKFDEFKQAKSITSDGASLLKSFVLDVAANSFAAQLNVLKTVVQYFVDTVKRRQAQSKTFPSAKRK
jgi:hypothetical protein